MCVFFIKFEEKKKMLSIKIPNRPFVYKIEISYNGNLIPNRIDVNQPFYDSKSIGLDFNNVYFGKGSLNITENSKTTKSGVFYEQTLSFSFASNDENRSERIEKLKQFKYLHITLNDGRKMVIGRNDFKQNAKIKPIFKSNSITTKLEIKRQSIFPLAFLS